MHHIFNPRIALLVAGAIASTVAINLDSWGWGIAAFCVAMFLFMLFIIVAKLILGNLRVALWRFGDIGLASTVSYAARIPVDEYLEALLDTLLYIGLVKRALRFSHRSYCDSLGLFVQIELVGNWAQLWAGGKSVPRINAVRGYFSSASKPEWKVVDYDPGDWEELAGPSLDLAHWLSTNGGLPEAHAYAFHSAIEVFKKEGHLELPMVS